MMKPPLTPEQFIEIARSLTRDERTPYAFEKRIMARLADAPMMDALSLWSRALWRAAAPCLGVMILAFAISWPTISSKLATENEVVDLESAVLAPTQLAFDLSR